LRLCVVHPASVDALVIRLDLAQVEDASGGGGGGGSSTLSRGWERKDAKRGAARKNCQVGPVMGGRATVVKTKIKKEFKVKWESDKSRLFL
jgi:hypothetical protein